MKQKWKDIWEPYMLRPLIYMSFTRFILALAAALLADFFLSPGAGRSLKSPAFLLTGALFALLTLIAFLRLDGVKLPKLMMLRINPRKKPSRMYGDIADHLDDVPMVTFEELDDDEKDLCILAADAFCCAVFFVIGALI